MNNRLFNDIFSDLIDTFCIEIESLAKILDRHPSRIRHWKSDSVPSKFIINDLCMALSNQIKKQNDPYMLSAFKNKWLKKVEEESLFTLATISLIKATVETEQLITLFIKSAYAFCYDEKSGVKSIDIQQNKENRNKYQNRLDIANAFESSGQFDAAETNYIEILSQHTEDLDAHTIAKIYASLGFINFIHTHERGDSSYYDKSIAYFEQSIQLFDKTNYPNEFALVLKKLGTVYNSFSEIHDSKNNIEKALHYYNSALDYIDNKNNFTEQLKVLHNIGIAYLHYSKVSDSLENIDKSIGVFELIFKNDLNFDPNFKALCEMNMGLAYSYKVDIKFSSENAKRAIELSNSALEFYTIENNPHYFSIINTTIGAVYLALSQIKDPVVNAELAIKALNKVLWIYDETTNPRMFYQCHYNLATAYLVIFGHTKDSAHLEAARSSINILSNHDDFEKFGMMSMTYQLLLGQYESACFSIGITTDPKQVLVLFDKLIEAQHSNDYAYYLGIGIIEKCNALQTIFKKLPDQHYIHQILEYREKLLNMFNARTYPIYFAIANQIFGDAYQTLYKLNTSIHYKKLASDHYMKSLSIYTERDYKEKHDHIQLQLSALESL